MSLNDEAARRFSDDVFLVFPGDTTDIAGLGDRGVRLCRRQNAFYRDISKSTRDAVFTTWKVIKRIATEPKEHFGMSTPRVEEQRTFSSTDEQARLLFARCLANLGVQALSPDAARRGAATTRVAVAEFGEC